MNNKSEDVSDIIDNLRRVYQAINEYSSAAVSSTSLTAPQLWALKILGNTAPLKVSELARRMYLHPATVVGILDRLESKELLTRIRSKKDRRVVQLHLTERGKDLVANAPEVAQIMLTKGLEGLSEEQFRCVEEGMKLMVRILDAGRITPQPLQG